MTETQEVHDLFRGTAEIGKRIRVAALLCELFAAAIAVQGIVCTGTAGPWRPVFAFALLLTAVVFRAMVGKYDNFAQQCRRVSVRAFALGEEVPISVCSGFRSDSPPCAKRQATSLPARTLAQYYEPQFPPGEDRLRQFYAYSSYYTWRLLKICKWVYVFMSVAILAIAVSVMYGLASSDTLFIHRTFVLDALFTIVLSVLGLRLLEAFITIDSSQSSTRSIADSLVCQPLPEGTRLTELIHQYDFERAGTPPVPTILYRIFRKMLDADWAHRRRALERAG